MRISRQTASCVRMRHIVFEDRALRFPTLPIVHPIRSWVVLQSCPWAARKSFDDDWQEALKKLLLKRASSLCFWKGAHSFFVMFKRCIFLMIPGYASQKMHHANKPLDTLVMNCLPQTSQYCYIKKKVITVTTEQQKKPLVQTSRHNSTTDCLSQMLLLTFAAVLELSEPWPLVFVKIMGSELWTFCSQ